MNENSKIEIGICIICICILLPIFIISIYNRPSADDYTYAIQTHDTILNNGNFFDVIKSAWDTNIDYYNKWQGLYTSAFILSLQPGIWGENVYCLTTLIVALICFLCILGSMHIVNKHFIKHSFIFTVMASLILFTILMLWLPSPVQGLYWFNGAMNYMPWAFTNLLGICLIIELYFCKKVSKKYIFLTIFSTILSFLTSGGNHVTAFANILLMLIITFYLIFYKKRYYSLLPLIFAIIGFIIMYVAPGTAIRQAALSSQTIIGTILATVSHFKVKIGEWINLNWILSLILITPISFEIITNNRIKNKLVYILITILISALIICAMFCVPYYAMGYFGEGRLTNVVWITFMFCTWIIYTQILSYLNSKRILDISRIVNNKKYQIVSRNYICNMLVTNF